MYGFILLIKILLYFQEHKNTGTGRKIKCRYNILIDCLLFLSFVFPKTLNIEKSLRATLSTVFPLNDTCVLTVFLWDNGGRIHRCHVLPRIE